MNPTASAPEKEVHQGVVDRFAQRFKRKSKEDEGNEKRAAQVLRQWKLDAEARRWKELWWWRNDMFYRGQSFVFNKNSRKLEERKIDKVFVNKTRQQVRGITAYLNKEHPFVYIAPAKQADTAYSDAKNVQHLCSYWYGHLEMNKTNKKLTHAGGRLGLAWVKILWDPNRNVFTTQFKGNDGKTTNTIKGELTYDYCDTYDVYPDPRMTGWEDCRRITHALPRTLGELRANPKFKANADKIAADDKLAASEVKAAFLARGVGLVHEAENADSDQRTCILLEQYTKEYDDNGDARIRVTWVTAGGVFLNTEFWDMPFFPFEYFVTDIVENLLQSDGAIQHIRVINEALNRSATQAEDNADRMGKLHYITEKGSGINIIHDKIGTVMEVNQGRRFPEQSKPAGMPAYIENHQANLERWIEDIGGIHDASMGRLPTSRASGELVKGLQEGDSNSLLVYRDNFDDFLARAYKKMLATEKYYREKLKVSRTVPMRDADPLGRQIWVEVKPEQINLDDEIQVRSGTNMPFSNSARQEMVMNFYKEGLFNGTPQANAALKLMSIPDIENVLGNEQPNIERQSQELRDMVADKEIDDPIISEDHSVHIRVLDQFVNSEAWYKCNDNVKQQIMMHRQKHVTLSMQLAQIAQSQNVEAIKRSEVIQLRPDSLAEFTPIERTQFMTKFAVQSDADETQVRGGLSVQNPQEALQQADLENQMFTQGMAPRVSPTDNHQVHLEAHSLLASSVDGQNLSLSAQKFLKEHIAQHEKMVQTTMSSPGLLPNSQSDTPVPDHSIKTAAQKKKLKQELQGGQQQPVSEAPAGPPVPSGKS